MQVENHASANGQATVSNISIDGVDAPVVGTALDDTATVSTAEGETWDIPVLWIDNNLQLATLAEQDKTYMPALAFFVPQHLSVQGDSYTVTLSESLTKLFGTLEVISVYDTKTGITYILPATLKDYFTSAPASTDAPMTSNGSGEEVGASNQTAALSWIDIYCAETARNVFTDSDLEYIINLVKNTLEPQAVELLIDRFPAFKEAAEENQIGKEISMYIYYKKGDEDGIDEHESAPNALAYVSGDTIERDDEVKYCYLIGIDLDDLTQKDAQGNPVVDATTGKYKILRSGVKVETFNNTIVHELFHAFMDDYNRTGMAGVTDARVAADEPAVPASTPEPAIEVCPPAAVEPTAPEAA